MDRYLHLISFDDGGWGWLLLKGAGLTIGLAVATLPFGLALGLLVSLGQRSESKLPRLAATFFTTVFRGLPELLTLYLVYFGFPVAVQKLLATLGFAGSFNMPPFVAGMVALGLVIAAFSSEVWNGALNAIGQGQREAARSLGLNATQSFRLVVLPQLYRVALPGIGNNWMVLLKDTSLVSVITLQELMFVTTRANVVTKEAFFFFGLASLIYLFFSIVSMAGLGRLEAMANRGYQAR